MSGKYEIRKINKHDPNISSTVAWSDTWEWAKKIAEDLSILEDEKFSVFKGKREIKCLEDAMKNS